MPTVTSPQSVQAKPLKPLFGLSDETAPTGLRASLTWSGVSHGILIGLVVLASWVWPKPMVKPVPDMTFTLVNNPSKTLPDHADAKGDKPQLAGGKRVQNVLPVMPQRVILPTEENNPTADSLPTVKERPQPIEKTPDKQADMLLKQPDKPVPTAQTLVKPDDPPDNATSSLPTTTTNPMSTDTASSIGTEPTEQLAVSPDKMAPYFMDLKKTLSAHWQPPRGENSLRVIAQFTIQADGQITDIEIKESSGDAATDEAARKALETSSPLAALPTDWGVSSVPILFRFDYSVFGKSRPK
jgi:TonB family protein